MCCIDSVIQTLCILFCVCIVLRIIIIILLFAHAQCILWLLSVVVVSFRQLLGGDCMVRFVA